MIIKTKPLEYTLFHSSSPLDAMKCLNRLERSKNSGKSGTLFCRYIGFDCSKNEYIETLKDLDWSLQKLQTPYLKISTGLEKRFSPEALSQMKETMASYVELEKKGDITNPQLYIVQMGTPLQNERLEWTKKIAFKEILSLFDKSVQNRSESTRFNFGVKVLIWMEIYLQQLYSKTGDIESYGKVLFYGDIKRHEFFFLQFLRKMGCDILYMNPQVDTLQKFPEVTELSTLYRGRVQERELIPFPKVNIVPSKPKPVEKRKVPKPRPAEEQARPSRQGRVPRPNDPRIKKQNISSRSSSVSDNNEKSFEQLALYADTVVMIKVYNNTKQQIGSGSGVVITDDGFIVTNNHVVGGGCYYGVLFENDETEYLVPKLTKYHSDYDLAIIKVERKTNCININEKALVRGQQILSIGSPLGLFNTISEGIVSGFREIDRVDMVQISAPISPGSSGGALLDMCGNLAGITTAGFDAGQNLNLAVPSKYIFQIAANLL